mgnify:CR=1 FL=1
MIISIGCDHSALEVKNELVLYLESLGHTVLDKGTYTKEGKWYEGIFWLNKS